jgi:hypothetical protein
MKKLLIVLVAVLALGIPSAATSAVGAQLETPVGTLNLDVQNVASSTFNFNGATVPPDPSLEASNTDNVNVWVGGPGTTTDYVTQYPGFIRFQTLECARVQFIVPPPVNTVDTGWHCVTTDKAFTQDSITTTAESTPSNDSVSFIGDGNDNRAWYTLGANFSQVDLSSYAGLTLSGVVYSNVCTRIYLDVSHYSPGGTSGVNNETGCVGSTDSLTVQFASKSSNSRTLTSTTPCTGYSHTGIQTGSCSPTALSVRLAGGCVVPRLAGKTVAKARAALIKHDCRLGKITRKHSRVKRGRVIKPRMKVGSVHRVNTRVPLLVSRGR